MGSNGIVGVLKRRLGEGFNVLHSCSLQYQKGEVSATEYYNLALDILNGDAESLMQLVAKLPNAAKREAVQAVHQQTVSPLRESSQQPDVHNQHTQQESSHHIAMEEPNGVADHTFTQQVQALSLQQEEQSNIGANYSDDDTTAKSRKGIQTNCAGKDCVRDMVLVIKGGGDLSGNLLWKNVDNTPLGDVVLQFWQAHQTQPAVTIQQQTALLKPMSTPWVATGKSKHRYKGWYADLPMQAFTRQRAAEIDADKHTQAVRPVNGSGNLDQEKRSWPGRIYYQAVHGPKQKRGGRVHATDACVLDIQVPYDNEWQHTMQPAWLATERAQHPEAFPVLSSNELSNDDWQAPDFGHDDMENVLSLQDNSPNNNEQSRAKRQLRIQAATMDGTKRQVNPCKGLAAPRDAPIIVWFRRDLRFLDNPSLQYVASTGRPVLPVFIWAQHELGRWPVGAASRYWLHHSLGHLSSTLQARHRTPLLMFDATQSSSLAVLQSIALQTGATEVVVNRLYEPWCIQRDSDVQYRLAVDMGMTWRSFNSSLLFEPWDASPDATDHGCWFTGYGSVRFFRNGCMKVGNPSPPVMQPPSLRVLPTKLHPPSVSLSALKLAALPRMPKKRAVEEGHEWKAGSVIDWAAGIRSAWRFGEDGAQQALRGFIEDGIHHFETRSQAKTIQSMGRWEDDGFLTTKKDGDNGGVARRPPAAPLERFRADKRWTARISPYMAWGELSPRQVYHDVVQRYGQRYAATFLRRLAWRDLAYWALWRFPWMPDRPLRPQYEHQQWDTWWGGPHEMTSLDVIKQRWDPDDLRLRAWQRGETGYPLVDAGMRELWITGYMPNYMRHVAAGFLVEYLNIDWRHGQLWFHDTLVDCDVAINAYMWQNGGHSGMDQWNFVMHPVYAAKAADPEGDYVRRWVPELAKLPVEYIHQPWEAPITVMAAAGVRLGRTYPKRIVVDLERARANSLAAVVEMRKTVGRSFVLQDGNEALPLPDGRFARCITRIDYREESEEPLTKQAAADAWDRGRRPLRGAMAAALHEPLTNTQAGRNEAGGWSRVGARFG